MSKCSECLNYAVCDDEDKDCAICDAFERRTTRQRMSVYERTKAQVYATGNKWAIENFHATHD